MSEIFESLAAISDAVTEEDRVVNLLPSLPVSYSVLMTAFRERAKVGPCS